MTAPNARHNIRWNLWTGKIAGVLLAGALAACSPDPEGNPGAAGSSGAAGNNNAGSAGSAGSAGNAGSNAGGSGGGSSDTPLTPGKAGSGRLAYLLQEEAEEIVEVMDLDEAKVLYRSTLKEGYLQHFFLTPSGRHLVWDGNSEEGARVCWLIDLDTGTQTSCALGSSYQLSFVTGISADGTRVSYDTFTSDFKRILAIWEGGQVTELAPPEDGWTLCSACGGLSPDGQTVYALRFGSGGTFPPVKIWKQPVGGEAAEVASLPEGVSIQIQDNFFRMSEDGARAIFDCRSEQFPKTKQGACAVDLTTGALTLYPDLLSPSLQLDGKQLAGYLGFGALEGQLFSFGSAAPVATFPSRGVWPTLSPDGSRLAYKAIFNGDGGYAPSTMAVDGSDVVRVQGSGDSGNQGPMVWAR